MAKRFTDTELWDKEWFMTLGCKLKCLIRFLYDKCDAAGVWSPNWVLATTYVGEPVTARDLAPLADEIELLADGKIFIKDFVSFQYGTLTESCLPHRKVIGLLKKHGLYKRVTQQEAPATPAPLPATTTPQPSPPLLAADQQPRAPHAKQPATPEDEIEITPQIKECFAVFTAWIDKWAPRVNQMQEPFTIQQYIKVNNYFKTDHVPTILKRMHNWAPLLTRNVSAYHTLKEWYSKKVKG